VKTRVKPASRVAALVHETARDFFDAGAIDAARMAEYDALCLIPVPAFSSRSIRALRKRLGMSQETLASVMNTRVDAVRRWELGQTKPRGAALRLLQILDVGGPETVALHGRRRPGSVAVSIPARKAG